MDRILTFYRSQFVEIFKTDNTIRNQKIYKTSRKEIKLSRSGISIGEPFCM